MGKKRAQEPRRGAEGRSPGRREQRLERLNRQLARARELEAKRVRQLEEAREDVAVILATIDAVGAGSGAPPSAEAAPEGEAAPSARAIARTAGSEDGRNVTSDKRGA